MNKSRWPFFGKIKCNILCHVNSSEDKTTTTQVIREIYEGDEHDTFEVELEKALESKTKYIIIEPQRLGDETARWIRVGNCLHKTAVLSGLTSIVCATVVPERLILCGPFCAVSVFCTGLYTISWNVDCCCQYQVNVVLLKNSQKKFRFWPFHVFFSHWQIFVIKTLRCFVHSALTNTQVETDPKKLEKIPDFQNFSSPVALTYTKNTRTKYLHRSVTLLAATFCAWRLYEAYK